MPEPTRVHIDRAVWVYDPRFRALGYDHPAQVRHALCPDGVRRTVRLNQQADTYFSWPGRTTIKGRSVRGFVSTTQDDDATFTPYTPEA